ncbi:PREDICTED: organ-specific protein P4-like isoform X1 [Populus euphratica]|uniref:Organ-specific protein P4-like isoform X1 n=1 Tax=Populus euphratica TaxID=75702 RepID=A0AAJ6VJ32_POPEU|nr:PREDICTED: organ-specific protein P4-like isoform X1 [Populus euphratica]
MKSSFAFFVLFSLFSQFSDVIGARKDTGEYWRAVMKDQPMPEAIQGLIRATTLSPVSNEKANCHTTESNEKHNFVKDFRQQPTATSYDNGIEPAKNKYFSEDSDPKPNVSVYNDGVVKGERSFAEDFEPRPNVSVFHDDATLKGEKSFTEDFEPRPSISVYDDGVGLKGKKSFPDEFKPRRGVTAYSN